MNAAALLDRLHSLGVIARVDAAGTLRLRPPKVAPPDLLAALRANKAEVVALLARPALPNDPGSVPGSNATPAETTAWLERQARGAPEGFEADGVPSMPDARPDSASEAQSAHNQAILEGYRQAALQSPPSWWVAQPHHPPPGTWCSCCRGRQWWSRDRKGWCCETCHPYPYARTTARRGDDVRLPHVSRGLRVAKVACAG